MKKSSRLNRVGYQDKNRKKKIVSVLIWKTNLNLSPNVSNCPSIGTARCQSSLCQVHTRTKVNKCHLVRTEEGRNLRMEYKAGT